MNRIAAGCLVLFVVEVSGVACVKRPPPATQMQPQPERPEPQPDPRPKSHAHRRRSSEPAPDWVGRLTTPNERFYSESRLRTAYPTAVRGAFPGTPDLTPKTHLRVITLSCTDSDPGANTELLCTGMRPADRTGKRGDPTDWKRWVDNASLCLEVQVEPLPEPDARRAEASLRAWGRVDLPAASEGAVYFVQVEHVRRQRVYENGCEGVTGLPCDPSGSWPTDRFQTFTSTTLEVVTSAGALDSRQAPAFLPQYAPLHTAMFGERVDGWFVPAPAFFGAGDGTKPAVLLETLLQTDSTDPDDLLALKLSRATAAVEAKDPRAPALAETFVQAAAARPLPRIHFELRPIVMEALPFLREVAAGRYALGDPCHRRSLLDDAAFPESAHDQTLAASLQQRWPFPADALPKRKRRSRLPAAPGGL